MSTSKHRHAKELSINNGSKSLQNQVYLYLSTLGRIAMRLGLDVDDRLHEINHHSRKLLGANRLDLL